MDPNNFEIFTTKVHFNCSKCSRTFRSYQVLLVHLRNNHKFSEEQLSLVPKLSCPLCQKQFTIHCRLRQHMDATHFKRKYVCKFCGKGFSCNTTLQSHLRLYTGEKPFRCESCSEIFGSISTAIKHRKLHRDGRITCDGVITCPKCPKTYTSTNKYLDHIIRGHRNYQDMKFVCYFCGSRFLTRQYLENHLIPKHLKEKRRKNLPCDKCGKFYTQLGLQKHLQLHEKQQLQVYHPSLSIDLKCNLCHKIYNSRYTFKLHKCGPATVKKPPRMEIKKIPIYKLGKNNCYFCKLTVGKYQLLMHMTKHTKERPQKCNFCDKKFSNLYSLTDHVKNKHGDVSEIVSCSLCQKRFLSTMRLNQHLKKIHSVPEEKLRPVQKISCTICSKQFTKQHKLHLHYNVKHSEPQFSCEFCGKLFQTKTGKENHLSFSHLKELQYKCFQCEKRFAMKSFLKRHKNVHISEDKRKKMGCTFCPKSFLSQTGFEHHVRTIHKLGIECPHCDRTFYSRTEMRTHVLVVHENKRPFSCNMCEMRFRSAGAMDYHIKEKHFGYRPRHCETCGKRFTSRSKREEHESLKICIRKIQK